ncbi:uncharacterized protein BX663DRAFT_581158 [Cokeromyces recurvatus]|uniref:uncharacterized protein n=1 Tax=Cokeromyces recurvatus TaxID=90255 RepID=UPI002220D8CC|nr:uncharacterized protein BX663DRAFT_581158 [Cokeromyces recurvatus]KAI7906025.1 hypothetical protein BX663DRAFT_581158 [Cokeromyces recurvatus]
MKVVVPGAAENHYVATPTEFINKNKYDVLYALHGPLSTYPLVFIEVQNQVDEKFLVRVVHYSTFIYERYKKLSIFVIIGVASAMTQFMSMTAPNSVFLFARHMPCVDWVLGLFICSQSLSMSTLDCGKNGKWVRLLYSIAHANLKQLSGEKDEKLEAISSICSSSQVQPHKIKGCLEIGDKVSIEKVLSYVDDALGFLQ